MAWAAPTPPAAPVCRAWRPASRPSTATSSSTAHPGAGRASRPRSSSRRSEEARAEPSLLQLRGVEMRKDGQDATVGVLALLDLELHEDMADVRFDGAFAEV